MTANEVSYRQATAEDQALLIDMLVEAVNWSQHRVSPDEVIANPEMARYVDGWPRADDIGVVAVANNHPVGAVWLRFFTADEPGYGYVADDIPELSMAVVGSHRGQGIGRALLREIATQARSIGIKAISLSVEHANPAGMLYASEGYQPMEQATTSDTLIKHLEPVARRRTPNQAQ